MILLAKLKTKRDPSAVFSLKANLCQQFIDYVSQNFYHKTSKIVRMQQNLEPTCKNVPSQVSTGFKGMICE